MDPELRALHGFSARVPKNKPKKGHKTRQTSLHIHWKRKSKKQGRVPCYNSSNERIWISNFDMTDELRHFPGTCTLYIHHKI